MRLAKTISAQGRSLVFVDTYPSYLQHPTPVISNGFPVGGRTVYALARGAADFRVLRAFSGRALYRLRLLGEYGKLPHAKYGAQLEHVAVVSGRTLTLSFGAQLPAKVAGAQLEVVAGRARRQWSVTSSRPARFRFVLGPAARSASREHRFPDGIPDVCRASRARARPPDDRAQCRRGRGHVGTGTERGCRRTRPAAPAAPVGRGRMTPGG